jgi:hypothetical protein
VEEFGASVEWKQRYHDKLLVALLLEAPPFAIVEQ